MSLKQAFHRLADERPAAGFIERAAQAGLAAIAPVYGSAAWTNRLLHELGLRPRRKLPGTVFSVGNITLGGTGKTPFTIWLAKWLQSEGKFPAVLTRGYGRADEESLVLVHDGKRLRATTEQAGDEPVLIADALGNVPVIACSDRYRAGQLASRRFTVDSFVLDDGFQHVALERQAEVVLLDATRPLSGLRLFPRGTLREPLGALDRAHLIVLTRCDQHKRAAKMQKALRARLPRATVVRTQLEVASLVQISSAGELPDNWLDGKRVVLACGVGNPSSVRHTVESAGATVIAMHRLEDHARPTLKDVGKWERERREAHADAIIVTEKDAVKLRELGAMPARMVALRAELAFLSPADEEAAVKALRARLYAKRTRGLLK